ncbi:forkhead box protein J1-like isoform X2 [Cololabis saira]|uniref:forkhead box protein J1-like isoform X2 n=1 Tax=Cololabis saira TaxID=129043 RepID=UPI002AD2F28A|nr:forkhead box protein J1-like isoform X2 [Cololabis saira]
MGPTMPPSKKAQSPSSGASASQGMSPLYRQGDAAAAASEAEAADLSLSVSASFSKAEDEELTSLSWLHESTDLLNSFSHSGLRSVSPLQDPDGQHPRSPSSSSPSPDDPMLGDAHSAYDLAAGANRKPPYSFSCLIFMAIEDAPNKRLPVKDIYGWILEHFPYFANAPTGWKNSVRHNLSLNKCFKKVDKDRSQSIGKGSLWSIDPEYRHNLIQALKKTPYHTYSPGLATSSGSPPSLPQTFHHSSSWRDSKRGPSQESGPLPRYQTPACQPGGEQNLGHKVVSGRVSKRRAAEPVLPPLLPPALRGPAGPAGHAGHAGHAGRPHLQHRQVPQQAVLLPARRRRHHRRGDPVGRQAGAPGDPAGLSRRRRRRRRQRQQQQRLHFPAAPARTETQLGAGGRDPGGQQSALDQKPSAGHQRHAAPEEAARGGEAAGERRRGDEGGGGVAAPPGGGPSLPEQHHKPHG